MILNDTFYVNKGRDFYGTYTDSGVTTYILIFTNKLSKKTYTSTSGITITDEKRYLIIDITDLLPEEGQYTYTLSFNDKLYSTGLGTIEYSTPDIFEDEVGDNFVIYQDED